MKHIALKLLYAAALLLAAGMLCSAQGTVTLDNGMAVSPREALGQDMPYPFDRQEAVPRAPKGYKPFFIEHYGRHGSRFAYSNVYYETVKAALDQAEAKGLLTELGRSVKADYDAHYALYHMRMGDLTKLGWEQQLRLGREMAENYPKLFKRSDASVFAVSSDSRRSMMSMTGFCLGLGQAMPRLEIREDQGVCHLDVTQPKSHSNPYLLTTWPEYEFPFAESEDGFCRRKTACCPVALSRLFTDPDAALAGVGKETFVRKLYIVVAGMSSLNPEDRTDFSGVFTPEEFARMWEVDNYQRYREYYNYPAKTTPVLRSMVDDAEEAIEKGRYGAFLRFGHDHVVLPLVVLMRLDGFTRQPSSADEISAVYGGFNCPMAGNVQLVLYRSRRSADILVNIRFNGRNATVDGLESVCEGFYRWSDFRAAVLPSPDGK